MFSFRELYHRGQPINYDKQQLTDRSIQPAPTPKQKHNCCLFFWKYERYQIYTANASVLNINEKTVQYVGIGVGLFVNFVRVLTASANKSLCCRKEAVRYASCLSVVSFNSTKR